MPIKERLAPLLREPLVHFLLAGLAIFFFYGVFNRTVDVGDRRIVVTEAQVQRLATQWVQTWQRPPSAAELDGQIRDYIKEEIYYREALRLGLDKDDMVVRRRLRSKMEFLATSEAENAQPSDADLQKWLDQHAAKYAADPVFSFDQIYISAAGGDQAANIKAKALLKQVQLGTGTDGIGDNISLPQHMETAPLSDVSRAFGEDFARALKSQPVGAWSGPITSGFGLHLVRIRQVQAAQKPNLDDARQAVTNDWRDAMRETRENKAYQALLDGYQINIERPK